MRQLLLFFFRYRVFFTFLFLELLASWLIINRNSYQRSAFLSSSNQVIGGVFSLTNNFKGFVNLRMVNDSLAEENARLKRITNSLYSQIRAISFSPYSRAYQYVPAEVVNNSIFRSKNYFTINKGRLDGVKPGMGVVSPMGIAGQVSASSDHFATVYSALHSDMEISSQLKKNNALCTTAWKTGDPEKANLLYIPLHVEVNVGDTIVTSGYNTIYPSGTMIGTVAEVYPNETQMFQSIIIDLATNFRSLTYVYVIGNRLKEERDSLEAISIP